jgi:hypothetical protein
MRYFLWWPGYLILAFGYFFPGEWGKTRSVSKSGRRWKYRDNIAPFISLLFYIPVWLSWIGALLK